MIKLVDAERKRKLTAYNIHMMDCMIEARKENPDGKRKNKCKDGLEHTVYHAKVNGIDRVNNNIGYILNNCVACCKYCNIAKGVRTITEFLEHVQSIVIHQGQSNEYIKKPTKS